MNDFTPGFNRGSDPYLTRLKRRKTALGLVIALASCLALAAIAVFATSLSRAKTEPVAQKDAVLALWKAADYPAVSAACKHALETRPLDTFYLSLYGYASFYLALAESDASVRSTGMDEAIFSIRKALIDTEAPLRAESSYVLGKAYYHKGPEYYADALEYLAEAQRLGVEMPDSWEYLALAARGLGLHERGAGYFTKAIELRPDSAELLLAAALNAIEGGDFATVETLALAARSASSDDFLTERCDFILGDLYLRSGRLGDALVRYEEILKRNPESADGWYYQGLALLESGEPLKARAAFRKAVSIDPMHAGARQKLSERS